MMSLQERAKEFLESGLNFQGDAEFLTGFASDHDTVSTAKKIKEILELAFRTGIEFEKMQSRAKN